MEEFIQVSTQESLAHSEICSAVAVVITIIMLCKKPSEMQWLKRQKFILSHPSPGSCLI